MSRTDYEEMPLWKLIPAALLAILALPFLILLMPIAYIYAFLRGDI